MYNSNDTQEENQFHLVSDFMVCFHLHGTSVCLIYPLAGSRRWFRKGPGLSPQSPRQCVSLSCWSGDRLRQRETDSDREREKERERERGRNRNTNTTKAMAVPYVGVHLLHICCPSATAAAACDVIHPKRLHYMVHTQHRVHTWLHDPSQAQGPAAMSTCMQCGHTFPSETLRDVEMSTQTPEHYGLAITSISLAHIHIDHI